MSVLITKEAKPFLKWAGGKSQLLNKFEPFLPKELTLTGKINKYFEPFLGGGAVFFWLSSSFDFDEVYLYEINSEIVMCYNTIKKDVRALIKELSSLQEEFLAKSDAKREKFFYEIRAEYNSYLIKKSKNKFIRRSASLIFLNRTCFNGLYRVNSKGEFNVPSGRYENPTICDEENLLAVSEALKNAEIICGDFELCLEKADANSFVYFDPPYRPLNKTSSFTSYSKDAFDDSHQIRLKRVFDKLDIKGALVMLSNSDPKNFNPKDNFFDYLYRAYHI